MTMPIAFTEAEINEGRHRLSNYWPWAKAWMNDVEAATLATTCKLTDLTGCLARESLDALVVCRSKDGGWQAALVCKGTPAGVPPVLCPPGDLVCVRRSEAERAAVVLLFAACGHIARNEQARCRVTPAAAAH